MKRRYNFYSLILYSLEIFLKQNIILLNTEDYLCKINLCNGKTSMIYQTELEQCINNDHIVTW